jgi:hypothetical protein
MPAALFTPTFAYMLGGLIIWSIRFVGAYSFTAIACSRGWTEELFAGLRLIPLGVGLMTLAAILGCIAIVFWALARVRFRAPDVDVEENTRFVHFIAATVAVLALVAMIWETLPVLLIPACT